MCLAVPGQVIAIEDNDALTRQGHVAFGGVVKKINLAYVPEVSCGDYILVHAGFAIAVLDEGEARRTLAYLEEIEAMDEEAP